MNVVKWLVVTCVVPAMLGASGAWADEPSPVPSRSEDRPMKRRDRVDDKSGVRVRPDGPPRRDRLDDRSGGRVRPDGVPAPRRRAKPRDDKPGVTDESPRPRRAKPRTEGRLTSTALSHEQVGEMLESMGFEPQVVKSSVGTPVYNLTAYRDGWTFRFSVALSKDQSNLWLVAPLRDLPEVDKVRADILEKILFKNDAIGPAHFALKGDRRLFLLMPLNNRGLKSVYLRQQMDRFMDLIKGTHELWDPAKYPPKPVEKLAEIHL